MNVNQIVESWQTTNVEDDLRQITTDIGVRIKAHGVLERANHDADFRFWLLMALTSFVSTILTGVLEYLDYSSYVNLLAVFTPALSTLLLSIYRQRDYAGKRLGHINTANDIGSLITRIKLLLVTVPEARQITAGEFVRDIDNDLGRIIASGQFIPHTLLEELSKKQQ